MDIWANITAGRESFSDYLAALSPDEWNRPSLCDGWSAKEVVAHMLVIPSMTKGQVFRAFAGSGFNLDKMNNKLVKKLTGAMSGAELAAKTRATAGSQSMPPGLKLRGVLTELVVHSADVATGVGKPFALAPESYIEVLDHLKNVQPVFGSKKRVEGLTLRATDATWSTGSGPAVEGPLQQLVLAVAGRPAAYAALSGDGVATMKSR